MFNGIRVGLDFDFGLGESCFTFVGYDHFHEGFFRMRGHEWGYHINRERLHAFYGRSVIRNEFRRDEHGRFVNNGIGRDRVERFTHVQHSNFEERRPVGDRNQLASQRADHFEPGNAGHAGAGNLGHAGEVTSGAHVAGGNTGNAGHLGAGQPDRMAEKSNAGLQNSSVSKVFRPPATGASSGSSNAHSNPGSGKSNPVRK
jgi:hypothetical protein